MAVSAYPGEYAAHISDEAETQEYSGGMAVTGEHNLPASGTVASNALASGSYEDDSPIEPVTEPSRASPAVPEISQSMGEQLLEAARNPSVLNQPVLHDPQPENPTAGPDQFARTSQEATTAEPKTPAPDEAISPEDFTPETEHPSAERPVPEFREEMLADGGLPSMASDPVIDIEETGPTTSDNVELVPEGTFANEPVSGETPEIVYPAQAETTVQPVAQNPPAEPDAAQVAPVDMQVEAYYQPVPEQPAAAEPYPPVAPQTGHLPDQSSVPQTAPHIPPAQPSPIMDSHGLQPGAPNHHAGSVPHQPVAHAPQPATHHPVPQAPMPNAATPPAPAMVPQQVASPVPQEGVPSQFGAPTQPLPGAQPDAHLIQYAHPQNPAPQPVPQPAAATPTHPPVPASPVPQGYAVPPQPAVQHPGIPAPQPGIPVQQPGVPVPQPGIQAPANPVPDQMAYAPQPQGNPYAGMPPQQVPVSQGGVPQYGQVPNAPQPGVEIPTTPQQAEGSLPAMDSSGERAQRRKIFKGIKIGFGNDYCAVDGVMRNISDTGAFIEVKDGFLVPEEITIHNELEGYRVRCEVVRRESNRIGVRFISQRERIQSTKHQVVNMITADSPEASPDNAGQQDSIRARSGAPKKPVFGQRGRE